MPNEPILAVLSTPETAPSVLAAAGSLRARLDGPPILAVHLRPAVEPGFMPTEEVMTEDRAERFRAHEDGLSAALSEAFQRWSAANSAGSWATWREVVRDPEQAILELGDRAALIVTAHPVADQQHATGALVRHVLFELRRAIVLIPQLAPHEIGRRIAVAWKPSEAADRALQAALPLLVAAEQVIALAGAEDTLSEPPALPPARMSLDDSRFVFRPFTPSSGSLAQDLLRECRAVEADLLIMGAYSHNRLVEAMLGGVTRDMLAQAAIPLLMCH